MQAALFLLRPKCCGCRDNGAALHEKACRYAIFDLDRVDPCGRAREYPRDCPHKIGHHVMKGDGVGHQPAARPAPPARPPRVVVIVCAAVPEGLGCCNVSLAGETAFDDAANLLYTLSITVLEDGHQNPA